MREFNMRFLNYLLKQKKEYVIRSVKNFWYSFFLNIILLMLSFYLLIINSVYAGTDNQTKAKPWTFVTKENLHVKKANILVKKPIDALKILQEAFPNEPVESLHQFCFEAEHEHLGEYDKKRKTYFSSVPGFKELISVYSMSKLPSAMGQENPSWLTLSGMMKHLAHKEEIKDSQFEKLLTVLHTPVNTEEWHIYDGGTTDDAINNVAMEFYRSLTSGFKLVWKKLSGKEDSNTLINTEKTLRQQIYEQALTWHNKRKDSESVKYVVTLDDINSKFGTMESAVDLTTDESDDIPDNYTKSSWTSKPLKEITKYALGALMVSQCIGLGASASVPPYLATSAVSDIGNYCLAADGQCTYVGNANISRLMTEFPAGNFIAAEHINGSISPLNSTVTEAVVPGMFSGTFSTGNYSLDGFPINGRTALFESVNNSNIKVNIPVIRENDVITTDNAQPILARRALHNNKIEATLQPVATPDHSYYTNPVLGNTEGDYNKLIVQSNFQHNVSDPHFNLILEQDNTPVLTTEVSGNNNHLEQRGQFGIFNTVNNHVLGNTAKIITGKDNELIYKGVLLSSYAINKRQILLRDNYRLACVKGRGRLEIYSHINGTSQWATACSENFSNKSSLVACRQLGFDGDSQSEPDYYESSLPVLLNNVDCTGNEGSILQCPYDIVNQSNGAVFNSTVSNSTMSNSTVNQLGCTQPPIRLRCSGAKNYNNNTAFYSGILRYIPDYIAEAPFAFFDEAVFLEIEGTPISSSVDTTTPAGWRKAHQHLCAPKKCDISCHYVNEDFYSIVVNGDKTLLVSRQRYPEALYPSTSLLIKDGRGLIRVTDISQPGANGTIQLYQPRLGDAYLDTLTFDNPVAYTPPVSHTVTNNTLLLLHRRPRIIKFPHYDILDFKGEVPGVQLSEFDLGVIKNGTYGSVRYDFPGEDALLLNENAAFTYNETGNLIIQRPLEYDGEHYMLSEEANVTYELPSEQFITAGYHEDYLYVVTKEQINDQSPQNNNLTFLRYDLESGQRDENWQISEQLNDPFDEKGDYKLEFVDDKIHMLRRDEFNLNGIPHRLLMPQHGECSEIIRTDSRIQQFEMERESQPRVKDDDNTGANVGAAIGATIGGVALTASTIGTAVVVVKMYKNKKHNNGEDHSNEKADEDSSNEKADENSSNEKADEDSSNEKADENSSNEKADKDHSNETLSGNDPEEEK